MNISIFASIGAQNLGDELILKNEIELLRKEFSLSPNPSPREGSINFKVASYDPKNPIFEIKNTKYFEYFPFGIKRVRNTFRNVRNFLNFVRVTFWSHIVVIGGGGIIYDSEKQSVSDPLDQWIFRVKIAKFFRKKIYFYSVGIDIKKEENREKLEKIFNGAYKITVRDLKSQKQLHNIGIESIVVDDPVMNEGKASEILKGEILGVFDSQNFDIRNLQKYDFTGKKVGLALRSGYIGKTKNKKIENLLVEELCSTIESKGGSIVFLPHSFHYSDVLANDMIFMQQFQRGGRVMAQDMQEVYSYYLQQNIDLIFSMRLHSMVLAYTHGVDQIALSYSQKTDEFLKKIS